MDEIVALESEIACLEVKLDELRVKLHELQSKKKNSEDAGVCSKANLKWRKCNLSHEEIRRYSRQLILNEWGVMAQERLSRSKVLVVGAGGLGSPVCLYLAAAGVGTLGIVDGDAVDISNLHRQVIHSTYRANRKTNKADSAKLTCLGINPLVTVKEFPEMFTVDNAFDIAKEFDYLVDASDNVATRYLVNDVAVLLNKPLISASAVRTEGQLTVYNYGEDCPCYRCVFPKPPPPETVTNCADGGVFGPAVGVLGTLQATEVCKVVAQVGDTLAGRLLVYDAMDARIRVVKLRKRNANCEVCSLRNKGSELSSKDLPVKDYAEFCGTLSPFDESNSSYGNLSCEDLNELSKQNHVLLDVREGVQFSISSLEGSVNIPLSQLPQRLGELQKIVEEKEKAGNDYPEIFVMCRRGVFSRIGASILSFHGFKNVMNVVGGLEEWEHIADSTFPKY